MLQVGYVASLGRKLIIHHNINAAIPGTGSVQSRRPFNTAVSDHSALSISWNRQPIPNYHSLQTQLTQKTPERPECQSVLHLG